MKLSRMTLVTALAAALMTGSSIAADLERGDRRFLEKAADSGRLEIEASRLAVQRASNAQVKEFAQMMIADHTAVDSELKALASAKQVTLPPEPSRKVRSRLKSLNEKTGLDFDREYADEIADEAHDDAVELFEDAAKHARDPQVQAFAAKTLPSLQAHYDKGQALNDAVKRMRK